MTWLHKISHSDIARVKSNIARLEELKDQLHRLGDFALASQGGAFHMLEGLLDNQLVKGRPEVHKQLMEAYLGENNQKIALDAPTRFQRLMFDAESLVEKEIKKESRNLKELIEDHGTSQEE